ncbi:hypothetical protein [Mycobacterium sp.]|uniref:hypothetical protein n=1 Tax=Mycobacterium sp. TaxID=1785 RepID=UPI0025CCD8A0|nr:hypothetical protein [Mycobacterium sp.]
MFDDLEAWTHTQVLFAHTRADQGRLRAAVDAVFADHAELGTVFEPFFEKWMSRSGGGWGWAVEPPGAAVEEVVERHRASFDMRTGRLFNVSLLPGDPDRLVLTASRLCVDDEAWQVVVDNLLEAYGDDLGRADAKVPDTPRIQGLLRLLGARR